MADRSSTLALVGDVFPSRCNFEGGRALEPEFGEVVELLRSAAVAFGNFELACSERGYPVEKVITIRTSPERASEARDLGLDVVSVANNHIMDYGPQALLDTLERLDEVGVRHVGAGPDLTAATEPVVVEAGGARVGFLGWSTLLPTGAAATAQRPGLAPIRVHTAYELDPYMVSEEPATPPTVRTWADEADLAAAQALVRELAGRVDLVVASLHWGSGVAEGLAEYQRPLARALVEAGAGLVAGHHQHSVQGVEVYRGVPILYSPGLFLEQVPREGASAEILALYDLLSPDSYVALAEVGGGRVASLRLVPTSSGRDGLPRLARGEVAERILRRLRETSAALDTELSVEDGQVVVPVSGVSAARAAG